MIRNPILPGFLPDPSICRSGSDYFVVCSSFEYFPGIPIFHSRDLAHWRQIGNVLESSRQLRLAPDVPASRGIFAPTIRRHAGRFYVITTNTTGPGQSKGHLIVTATDPAGPWSEPVFVDLPGVDPDLCWDDDGACWCTFSGIRTAVIDPDTGRVLDGPWPVWSGSGLQYPEAPHLFRVHGSWYLLVSEGGTHTGHAVSIARASSPRGPFEPAPGNPILSHSGTSRPIQATGHADLVQAVDGSWWMTVLGIRQQGTWPRFHVLGRETFLTPVTWTQDWPVVRPVELVLSPPPAAEGTDGDSTDGDSTDGDVDQAGLVGRPLRDDFDAPRLDPGWISPRARPEGCWSLAERPGWLTLHATGPSLDLPGATLFGRRQQHHSFRAATSVEPGTSHCGLTVRLDEAHHVDLEVAAGQVRVVGRIGPLRAVLARHPGPVATGCVLVIEARTDDLLSASALRTAEAGSTPPGLEPGGPDVLIFRLETPSGSVVLAELDGRHLSTEAAGGFTGRVIGLYVTEGSAAFDWFEYGESGEVRP